MTVKELIEKLEKVENKELVVLADMWCDSGINDCFEEDDIYLVLTDDAESTKANRELD